jgi:hypothetical protein
MVQAGRSAFRIAADPPWLSAVPGSYVPRGLSGACTLSANRLFRSNVRTWQKETSERWTGRPLLMWWTAPAPGIEVP